MKLFKSVLLSIFGLCCTYFGFVQDIVFFRVIFDIFFGFVCFFVLFVAGFYVFLDLILKNDVVKKSVVGTFQKVSLFRWVIGLPVIATNWYFISQTFPTLAAWYLIVTFTLIFLSLSLQRKIYNVSRLQTS